MKLQTLAAVAAVALASSSVLAQFRGPSSSATPYVLPFGGSPSAVLSFARTYDSNIPATGTIETTSILTVGDSPANSTYRMAGIPDGLGAFDNNDGTFTLLINHELGNTAGAVRAHGAAGAFVSRWVIRKSDLTVLSGSDLIQSAYNWNTTTQASETSPFTFAFNRFCSADLPQVSAFYNPATGLGSRERIFMHGEEGGATGYQLATVVTGADAGKAYVLGDFNLATNGSASSVFSPTPASVASASTSSNSVTLSAVSPGLAVGAQFLGQRVTAVSSNQLTITLSGNANQTISTPTSATYTLSGVGAWENALANPFAQDRTIVIGNNDGGTGIMSNSVSVYVGTKQATGSEVDKAGLTNGTLKFVNVANNPVEIVNGTTRATNITDGTRFSLSGTASTTFSRPEDGAWNPLNPSQYYFVTTDRLDQVADGIGTQVGRSRLWRLTFDDISNPDAGGTIDMLLDGSEGGNMYDNLTVDPLTGQIWLQEDVGNAAHNGKIFVYNPATDGLQVVARHDVSRFGDIGIAATSPFNVDEETSGIIDVTSLFYNASTNSLEGFGAGAIRVLLSVDQAHYTLSSPLVEGGQLFAIRVVPEPTSLGLLIPAVALLGRRRSR